MRIEPIIAFFVLLGLLVIRGWAHWYDSPEQRQRRRIAELARKARRR